MINSLGMNKTLCRVLAAVSLLAPGHSAPAQVLVTTNLSFEQNAVPSGGVAAVTPAGWTSFNKANGDDIGSQNAGGTDYTKFDPLAAPADGNQYCFINMFTPGVTGGIYQDVGPLRPNATYTLTVAIGCRNDRINSPGIISLLNGADNTGAVLASGGGLPAAENTWRDYSISFTSGPSVSGDVTIVLSVAGNATTIQADFDNVRLAVTPAVLKLPAPGPPGVSVEK